MRTTFLRKAGIGAAVAATAALTLAGCAGGSAPAADSGPELSDEPVTISLTWWGGDARAEQTQAAIDAFEAEYPNITVEPQYTDWNGYWDQLATSTAAGEMPDVVQMDELYLASYGARGALYDLGGLDVDTSDIADEALATGLVDGTQYALPIGVATYSLIANADLFAQYGVDLPDDETWTWDDYADLATELTEQSGGAITGSAQIVGFDTGGLKYWVRQAGEELFDESGDVTASPETIADMWQYQLDLIAAGGLQQPAAIVESQTAGISAGAIATGKVALGSAWNTQITALADASGADLRLVKLPEPKDVHPNFYKPSMYWSVSSKSEHPAEAALLIDFLTNSETAADIIGTERGIPANDAIREYLSDSLTPTNAAAVEYLGRITAGDAPVVTPNGASGIEGILQRYTQEVLAGQTKPLDAAEAFIAELQAEIDAA
ncbi:ABC transporter substrate-binding protein [Agromyces sp. MMS24-JH15]|uniref:ABC transporter substrate-binding protein n=1 Tax=Agromyces sp. MMS24-JH15 TaxID=3243765 RepID=UPI003748F8D2